MTETDTALAALAKTLGAPPPPGLAALDAAAVEQLTALLRHSRQRQQQQLQRALEGALGYIPVLARGTVRRILFPER